VVAPIPSASVSTTVIVNPGDFLNWRAESHCLGKGQHRGPRLAAGAAKSGIYVIAPGKK
jgi:hypothetical protein